MTVTILFIIYPNHRNTREPFSLVEVSFETALHLSAQLNIYADDAYLLVGALKYQAPLLSLDKKLVQSAKPLNLAVLEVTL